MSRVGFKDLRDANVERAEIWNGDAERDEYGEILFRATELGGEAGEVLDAVKKYARYLKDMAGGKDYSESRQAVADELADTIICCDRVAEMMNIDLSEAVKDKFNETSDKHGFHVKL